MSDAQTQIKDTVTTNDVVVVLMTDPTDIDSKQATCVKQGHPAAETIFSQCYKLALPE